MNKPQQIIVHLIRILTRPHLGQDVNDKKPIHVAVAEQWDPQRLPDQSPRFVSAARWDLALSLPGLPSRGLPEPPPTEHATRTMGVKDSFPGHSQDQNDNQFYDL